MRSAASFGRRLVGSCAQVSGSVVLIGSTQAGSKSRVLSSESLVRGANMCADVQPRWHQLPGT
jgi:hypothetical protein